jgi:hypothetical protein
MRHRIPATSFQPQEEESKKIPMMRKMPAINRYMPSSSTRKKSEAPGATNRINPKRATTNPSTRTSPQGRASPLPPVYILTFHLPLAYVE